MQGKLQRDGIPFFPPDAMDYGVKICPPQYISLNCVAPAIIV